MEQQLEIKNKKSVKISTSKDLSEIEAVLNELLYVPDVRLKPRILTELIRYLGAKICNKQHKLKFFIAHQDSELTGYVVSHIHPTYTSYSRKCGTFGWLMAKNFETCKKFMKECELFMRKNKVRKIRGNINFPKGLGGIGIQESGFEDQMMYGVAFNNPKIKLLDYLDKLGYIRESEYTCMKVTKKSWSSGKIIAKGIKLGYLTLKELIEKKDEIYRLAQNSFHAILPDRSGFESRFKEFIDTYSQVPISHYKLKNDFDPRRYSEIPEFVEAWESCDLEKVVTWAPMAFDKKTDELVGIILSLPDLYELWLGQPITRNNVDTVMVNKNYAGNGIFSSLNNIGQLTCNLNGITYVEGTSIWSNNKDAINSIFPHCEHIRKHYVFQKRG